MDRRFEEYQGNGADVPEDRLDETCLNILPDELRKEVRRDRALKALQDAHESVMNEMGNLDNERVAAVHSAKRKQQLGAKPPRNYIHAAIGDGQSHGHDYRSRLRRHGKRDSSILSLQEDSPPVLLDLHLLARRQQQLPRLALPAAGRIQNGETEPAGFAASLIIHPTAVPQEQH